MYWLLLAAELTNFQGAKSPLRSVLDPGEVPVNLLTVNQLETVALALTVDPSGTVRGCSVEATSGDSRLDSYTCRTLSRRAKLAPSQTYFVYRTHIDWWIGDKYPPKSIYADLALTVAALPAGLRSPAFVRVQFTVDRSGKISGCTPEGEKIGRAHV